MNDARDADDEHERPLDPSYPGGDPTRKVERDTGPLSESPTIGGSGGSGSRAVLPDEPRDASGDDGDPAR